MRNRFFFIILTTLVLAAVGINLVHVRFFQSQRLKLIDKQIAESSALLTTSPDFAKAIQNIPTIEEAISKALKGIRIGKVFVLRDEKGKIVYQSFNVGLLEAELPVEPEWLTVHTDTEFVRVRNIILHAKSPMVLQVGLVLDRNFINWEIVDSRVVQYVTGIVFALFLASVALTLILLSPLRLLIEHLKVATSSLMNMKDVQPLPLHLARFTNGYWAKSDEFSILVSTVQKLIGRINLNYKLTRSWTFQMAHELKTPLAIIRAETESNAKEKLLPNRFSENIFEEIHHMSEIINQFLEWAELENSNVQKDLHALRAKNVIKAVAARLDKIGPKRIRLDLSRDFAVFANPTHLDQLVSNILTNALKFSPQTAAVNVTLLDHKLEIQDHGQGIPQEVRERIGEPFNIGAHENDNLVGNGLGLAWVSTVSKLYGWDLEIQSDSSGTKISVVFPIGDRET